MDLVLVSFACEKTECRLGQPAVCIIVGFNLRQQIAMPAIADMGVGAAARKVLPLTPPDGQNKVRAVGGVVLHRDVFDLEVDVGFLDFPGGQTAFIGFAACSAGAVSTPSVRIITAVAVASWSLVVVDIPRIAFPEDLRHLSGVCEAPPVGQTDLLRN